MKVFVSLLLFMCQFSFLVQTIATVCMFLAGKVEETPRPLKDVILVSYEIINKKDADAVQRIKQRVKQLGIIIIHLVSAPLTSEQFCLRQPWKWQSGGFGRFCLGHFQVVKHLGWCTGQLGSSYFGFRSLESKLSQVMGHFVFWLFQILGYSGFRLYIGSIGSETLVLCFGSALVWVSLGSGLGFRSSWVTCTDCSCSSRVWGCCLKKDIPCQASACYLWLAGVFFSLSKEYELWFNDRFA